MSLAYMFGVYKISFSEVGVVGLILGLAKSCSFIAVCTVYISAASKPNFGGCIADLETN